MMKQGFFEIGSTERLREDVCRLRLTGDASAVTTPGQFVNIRVEGQFLRRPLSVCDFSRKEITVVFRTVGAGTETLAAMETGSRLDLLTGLGNGFDTAQAGDSPLLIGGGLGFTPLYALAKQLRKEDRQVTVLLGFNRAEEILYEEEFRGLGCEVLLATADGSRGTKGFVTDALPERYSYFYACGPEPMLKALTGATVTSGQLSFERRMGCGFGACMGCTCRTVTGGKRICREGPVLRKEELLWED